MQGNFTRLRPIGNHLSVVELEQFSFFCDRARPKNYHHTFLYRQAVMLPLCGLQSTFAC